METEIDVSRQQPAQSTKGERYTFLVSRREALEAKLQEKNDELKRLCIAEAELTGILPPEIPLEPGEALPTFRRRVGTSFTLPENLINKLISEEEQSIPTLELEYEIQSHITAAALQLANDTTAKKGLRRQRRFEYQQKQRRLQELEAQLNKIKLNQSSSQKHRKKPRPSIDGESGSEQVDRESHDSFISTMSSSKCSNHLNGGSSSGGGSSYLDVPYHSNTISHSHSHSHMLPPYSHMHHSLDSKARKPQERLHVTLSAPQYSLSQLKTSSPDSRTRRPQLQRLGSGGFFAYGMYQQGYSSPQYSTLSSYAHPEIERLNRHDTAFIMSPNWNPYGSDMEKKSALHHHYMQAYGISHTRLQNSFTFDEIDGREFLEPPTRHPSLESRVTRWNKNRFGSLDRKKHMAHSNPCLESRSVEGLDILQADTSDNSGRGNYLLNNRAGAYTLEKTTSSSKLKEAGFREQLTSSLSSHAVSLGDDGTWHNHQWQYDKHYANTGPSTSNSNVRQVQPAGVAVASETLLPGQTYPEHSFGQVLPAHSDRGGLTRTQSLGSVEVANAVNAANIDTRSIKDMYPSTSYTQQKNDDASLKKLKEKEWQESSLDTPTASHSSSRPPSRRPSGHSGYEAKLQPLESHSTLTSSSNLLTVSQNLSTSLIASQTDISHSMKSMQENIQQSNTEQSHPKAKSEVGSEYFDTLVPFESPKNHMVIQAGKWQPYWEVTKPFEMSDFYKYSTKFRKKTGGQCKQENDITHGSVRPNQGPQVKVDADSTNQCVLDTLTPSMSPQQKGVYQPLQPMTCHPLELSSGTMPAEQSPKPAMNNRNKTLSPNTTLDTSLNVPNGESLADAFSTEMLAWYQDKSSLPCSATLV